MNVLANKESMLLLMFVIFAQTSEIRGQQKNIEKDSTLELIVPAKLTVKFGEPVFVPLVVRNKTSETVSAPAFRYHYTGGFGIKSNGLEAGSLFKRGVSLGMNAPLPPWHMETTVLLLNIWTPNLALAMKETGKGTVEISTSLLPYLHEEMELSIKGTCFTIDAEKRLLEIARALVDDPVYATGNPSPGNPSTCVFEFGQTPLSWLDPKLDKVEEWDNPESQLFQDARSLVSPDTKLDRMMRCRVMMYQLCGLIPAKGKTAMELLNDYFELVDQCEEYEKQYHLVALKAFNTIILSNSRVREPGITQQQIYAAARKRFPLYAMYFNLDVDEEAGEYSVISGPVPLMQKK